MQYYKWFNVRMVRWWSSLKQFELQWDAIVKQLNIPMTTLCNISILLYSLRHPDKGVTMPDLFHTNYRPQILHLHFSSFFSEFFLSSTSSLSLISTATLSVHIWTSNHISWLIWTICKLSVIHINTYSKSFRTQLYIYLSS